MRPAGSKINRWIGHAAAKPLVFLFAALPFVWLVWAAFSNQLGANPAEALIRSLGDWTLRGGVNVASNPVPDSLVNPLFPAIVENHLTLGAGYRLSGAGEINAAMAYAPSVQVSTPTGVIVSHRQLNMQLMYSHRF